MRYHILLPIILAGCAAQAATQNEDASAVVVTELPPIDIASAPPVEGTITVVGFPKRTIEVDPTGTMVDGQLNHDQHCYVVTSDDPYTVDYNGCCPAGWHPLAASPNGLICEEE